MKKTALLLTALALLSACDQIKPTTGPAPKAAVTEKTGSKDSGGGGTVNIDGERITVYRQSADTWSAAGGDNGDPERYIIYRKERAIELKSGCRIARRLSSGKKNVALYAEVKCGGGRASD